MYSVYHNNIIIILTATSLGHNGHHQAVSQKLHYSAKCQFIRAHIYSNINVN